MTQENDAQRAAGVREGDVLAGKYRVQQVLGSGGMGVVVAALHLQLQTKVAVKFLRPEMLDSEEAVARFDREARAAVRIMSEHVARVLDVGTLENGAPYIVMEFLEGGDLAAWLRQRGALPIEQAVEFVLQACEAIAEAHALGIVHRDLKPANLFCIRRADDLLSIKVLDFGISKVSDAESAGSVTKTSAILGSPLYMSPEQMKSTRDVDARTDLWALGVILYELLTRRAPFVGETFSDICIKIATQPPPRLRDLRPDAPEGLEAVILKCLEKDRAARYANVADLARSLVRFGPERGKASYERITRTIHAAGLSTSAMALPPSSDPTSQPPTGGTIAALGRTTRGISGKRAVFAMGAAGALLLATTVGATAIGLVRWVRPTPRLPPSTEGDRTAGAFARSPSPSIATTIVESVAAAPASAMVAPDTSALSPLAPPASVTVTAPSLSLASHATARPNPPTRVPATSASPPAHPTPSVSSAKPNCDPNFYLDDQGQKHFKPECF